jgi:hypothetical protein
LQVLIAQAEEAAKSDPIIHFDEFCVLGLPGKDWG